MNLLLNGPRSRPTCSISVGIMLLLGCSMVEAGPVREDIGILNDAHAGNASRFRSASLTPPVKKDLSSSSVTDNLQFSDPSVRQVLIQSASGVPIISVSKPTNSGNTTDNNIPNILITSGPPVVNKPPSMLSTLQDAFEKFTSKIFALPDLLLPKPRIDSPESAPMMDLKLSQLLAEQTVLFYKNKSGNPFSFPHEIFNPSKYHSPTTTSFGTETTSEDIQNYQTRLLQLTSIMTSFIDQMALSGITPAQLEPGLIQNTSELLLQPNSKAEIPSVVEPESDEVALVELIPRTNVRTKPVNKAEPFHTVIPIVEPEVDGKSDALNGIPMKIEKYGESSVVKVNPSSNSSNKGSISKTRPVYGYQAAEYRPKQPSVKEKVADLVNEIYRIVFDSYGLTRQGFTKAVNKAQA